ncbi:MAG: hypothetical protein AAGA54_36800 [Myxococcota bacterium]
MNHPHGHPHQHPPHAPGHAPGHPQGPAPGGYAAPPPGYGPPPGPGHAPPPPAGAYVPPQNYGPPPGAYGAAAPMDPRVKELNDQSNTWLIVSIVGFWVGVGFITGPLSWLKANAIRRNYRTMGMQPSGTSTAAMIIGMVSSLIYVAAVIGVIMMFTLLAGAVAVGG